jgi:hypothetical protein
MWAARDTEQEQFHVPGSNCPVPLLRDEVYLDTEAHPLFGGEKVCLLDYILFETAEYTPEEDIYTQQRIARARGAVLLNFDDFAWSVQQEMDYMYRCKGDGYDVPRFFYQHRRNMLLAQKMLEIEQDFHRLLLMRDKPYSPSQKRVLEGRKSLYKSRVIACEKYICSINYDFAGEDFKCWSDNPTPESILEACYYVCPPELHQDWRFNNESKAVVPVKSNIGEQKEQTKAIREVPVAFFYYTGNKKLCTPLLPTVSREVLLNQRTILQPEFVCPVIRTPEKRQKRFTTIITTPPAINSNTKVCAHLKHAPPTGATLKPDPGGNIPVAASGRNKYDTDESDDEE